ncbi:MAG: helix-turn-helix transcriptional regulator [Clostridia bacterium]|nr:helix-turn-helix transcriptional regulator [Clostridia bacterium]
MNGLSSSQWEKIDEIVLKIYAEQDLRKMRLQFLDNIQNLIPHDKSFFDLGYIKKNQVVFFDPVTNNMKEEFLAAYFDTYEPTDVMFWFFSQNNTDIYRESDYITEMMLETSAFYNEWLKPQGIRRSIGARVAMGNMLYGSVTLWREEEHGDFSDDEVQILEILNRHLAQYFYNKYPKGIKRNNENEYSDSLIHIYGLTEREAEIVDKIYQGYTSKDVSEALFISENTVKKHTYNIFKKMNVKNRSQVIRIVHGFDIAAQETLTDERKQKLDK